MNRKIATILNNVKSLKFFTDAFILINKFKTLNIILNSSWFSVVFKEIGSLEKVSN